MNPLTGTAATVRTWLLVAVVPPLVAFGFGQYADPGHWHTVTRTALTVVAGVGTVWFHTASRTPRKDPS